MISSTSISAELADHLAYLEAALAASLAAPLSAKKAMLCALLIDAFADRLFEADRGHDDILAFRDELAVATPALATVFALAALRPDGPRLVTEAVEVPLAEYGTLAVEDFMVSVYNDHSIQRVRIAFPDGERQDLDAVLSDAIAALRGRLTIHP